MAREVPAVPTVAVVETFDAADGLGKLRLASGELVAFGRSACAWFEPAVGQQVIVEAFGLGWRETLRATRIATPDGPTYTSPQHDIFFRPIATVETWGLAAAVMRAERPEHARARDEIRAELERRGIPPEEVAALAALVMWADGVLNPPGQTTKVVICGPDDFLRALAASPDTPAEEAARIQALVARYG